MPKIPVEILRPLYHGVSPRRFGVWNQPAGMPRTFRPLKKRGLGCGVKVVGLIKVWVFGLRSLEYQGCVRLGSRLRDVQAFGSRFSGFRVMKMPRIFKTTGQAAFVFPWCRCFANALKIGQVCELQLATAAAAQAALAHQSET